MVLKLRRRMEGWRDGEIEGVQAALMSLGQGGEMKQTKEQRERERGQQKEIEKEGEGVYQRMVMITH